MSDVPAGHMTISPGTKVFVCANCGALALDPNKVCRVQGMIQKADFCGSESNDIPQKCKNSVNNLRFICGRCNRVAVNPEILCQPVKMEK